MRTYVCYQALSEKKPGMHTYSIDVKESIAIRKAIYLLTRESPSFPSDPGPRNSVL